MLNEDSFSNLYDSMNENFGELERIMGSIYQYTQSNPSDENAKTLLVGLGEVAKKMIGSQREFTISYGDATIKDSLVDILNDKESALVNALEETKGKSK